jgi:hypothetical protein
MGRPEPSPGAGDRPRAGGPRDGGDRGPSGPGRWSRSAVPRGLRTLAAAAADGEVGRGGEASPNGDDEDESRPPRRPR